MTVIIITIVIMIIMMMEVREKDNKAIYNYLSVS